MGSGIGPREEVILRATVEQSVVTSGEFDSACCQITLRSLVRVMSTRVLLNNAAECVSMFDRKQF